MTEQVTSASTWRVTSASRKGSSHGDDSPNQDAVQFVSVKDRSDADVWVAAVSDGHGGRRYVRSDVGSSLAVGTTVTHLAEVLHEHTGETSFEGVLRGEVPAIVSAWRAGVASHLLAHPFTDDETERAGVDLDRDPVVAYGATLLIVVVGEAGVGLAQIGDGDALIRTHGFATRPVPGDARLVAGETTSLCLDTAVSDFRYAALPGSADPDLVLLATDGYGNSFADKHWWRAVVGDLAWFLAEHEFDDFAVQFPSWLGDSATVGGDDVTAVVIARAPLVVPPAVAATPVVAAPPGPEATAAEPVGPRAAPPPAAVEDRPADGAPATRILVEDSGEDREVDFAPPGARRSGRRRVAVLVAAVVVALVVAGVGWLASQGLGGSGEPSSPRHSETPTVTVPKKHRNPGSRPGAHQQGGGQPRGQNGGENHGAHHGDTGGQVAGEGTS